ncbi:hypothetical protein ACS0TY_009283 [Phlomoides rotata]
MELAEEKERHEEEIALADNDSSDESPEYEDEDDDEEDESHSQISEDATESVAKAEEYLKKHRPVRRRHGKILEEGASGFLGKTIVKCDSTAAVNENADIDWDDFNEMCSDGSSLKDITFGNKYWASVYLANTPQEAAELGLNFTGVHEVEEIDGVDGTTSNPFLKAAIENESDLILTEEQKRNFRKIKEDDDANDDLKLRNRMKRRRRKQNKEVCLRLIHKFMYMHALFAIDELKKNRHGTIKDDNEHKTQIYELSSDSEDKKCCIVSIDCENEAAIVIVSSSDSESNESDTKRRRKKKLRRILDDAELGEETKMKIAIEKERQERLKSLEGWHSTSSKSLVFSNGLSNDGAGAEKLDDNSSGYIINVLSEEGEEAVRIPPSISRKLKHHQIAGIRFMWENVIQSVKKVRSGDRGLGCILAHMMGLGKTLQVVAFLYTVMRSVDLGLKTALVVTPVSVQHNWRYEFNKWRPSELQPLQIFMLEDVPREKRLGLLMKWRTKGGVFLIGYTAFRNLSLGKYVKDPDLANDISQALQVGPDIVVCDEAHIVKNAKSTITQALKQVKCQRRIALTGSPLQNNLLEYHCMVDFVRQGYLGSIHEFRNRFQNPIEHGQHTNSTAHDVKIMNQRSHILHEQLKGFVQRIDSSVVINDLPSKTVYVITVKLSSLQRKLYKKFLDVHGFRKDKATGEKKSFFAGYQALAQIWNHPGILQLMKENKDPSKYEDVENCLADDSSSDENVNCNLISGGNPHKKLDKAFVNEDWWRDLLPDNNYNEVDFSGKMVLLLDILRMCSDMDDKALVFSQSLLTLDLIEMYLSKLPRPRNSEKCWEKGRDWYRLDGRTESSERQTLVQRFNDPSNKRVKCTLISTRAGSLGINLYSANRVIIVDGSWNPTYDLQAIYRAWRYGQTKPVFAYRLLAHATMEEKIYKRQVTKEGLAARVVDKQQVHRTISKEEMLDLFDFGGDENGDVVHESGQEEVMNTTSQVGNLLKHGQPPTAGASSTDMVMQSLITGHHSSWISSYHRHETLLQENEDEKLSKEEQDLAWEVYRKGLSLEASHRASDVPKLSSNLSMLRQHKSIVSESALQLKPLHSTAKAPESNAVAQATPQKCTNLSHLLTLRSQGTKMGCSTVCGQCAQEIRWEDLDCDDRLVK